MKKKRIGLFFMMILFGIVICCNTVFAASAQSTPQKNLEIGKETVIATDYIGVYDNIKIDGKLEGNLFAATSGATRINGTVAGASMLACGETVISGTLTKDLALFALNAEFKGAVVGDDAIIVAVTSLRVDEQTRFADDVYIFSSGTVVIDGNVGGELFIKARSVVLDGVVGKNVKIYSEDIQIGSKTEIRGNLTYYSALNARVDTGAAVVGETEQRPPIAIAAPQKSNLTILSVGSVIAQILFLALLAWMMMRLWPRVLPDAAAVIKRKPFATFFTGIGIMILLFLLALLLTLTLIMLVPGLFFMGIFLFCTMLSILPVAYLFSSLYASKTVLLGTAGRQNFVSIVLAVALLELLSMSPYIGFGVSMLITGWGAGSFTVLLRERMKDPRLRNGGKIDEAR